MKLFALIAIFVLLALANGNKNDPKDPCPDEMMPPCRCKSIGFHSTVVTCEKAENENELQKSLIPLRFTPIQTLEIFDATLNFLPSDLFKGLKFERLFIAGSSLTSLSDTDTAFEGVEESLKTLILDDCTLLNGWEWAQIRNLRALEELRTTKSGPLAIDRDIENISHLNIKKLLFVRDKLDYVHDVAFSAFHNLETLSLKENAISTLRRSMFPNPANKLSQIIASHNNIQTLPRDLFLNMPVLRSLHLGNNPILTVEQKIFAPVWNQLIMFDVSGSPLMCDCRIKWIFSASFPKNFWATCAEPRKFKGKKIQTLIPSELFC